MTSKQINLLVGIALAVFLIFMGLMVGIWLVSDKLTQPVSPQNKGEVATSGGTSSKSGSNIYSMTDVAQHSQKNDCWLVINNNVYDVSNFISSHPGGTRTILTNCGKEVSNIFARIHSNFAWDLLKKYQIGSVGTSTNSASGSGVMDVVAQIKSAILARYPGASVINVKPAPDNGGIAKIVYQGALYEIHLDAAQAITKQETVVDEQDWNAWDQDQDDQ